jgi:hypothetical protein
VSRLHRDWSSQSRPAASVATQLINSRRHRTRQLTSSTRTVCLPELRNNRLALAALNETEDDVIMTAERVGSHRVAVVMAPAPLASPKAKRRSLKESQKVHGRNTFERYRRRSAISLVLYPTISDSQARLHDIDGMFL